MSDPENRNQGKGFNGLQSIGSKLPEPAPETAIISEHKQNTTELPPAWENTTPQPVQPQANLSQTAAPQWRGFVFGLGILGAIVVLIIWVGSQSSSNNAYSTAAAADYSSTVPENMPTVAPPGPTITPPPIGNGLVLTSDQIRYCVYEDRRIKGAEKAVNNYNQWSVDTFNAMVEDYNGRCGHFRYRQGALTPIEAEADQILAQLEQEGRERLLGGDVAGADAAQAAADAAADAADAAAAAANPTTSTDPHANGNVWVEGIELGSEIGSNLMVLDPKTSFRAMDTIYAVVTTATSGGEEPGILEVRWSYGENDQTVHEERKSLQFSGNGVTAFQISKPDGWPMGGYRVQITLDGREPTTRTFVVR